MAEPAAFGSDQLGQDVAVLLARGVGDGHQPLGKMVATFGASVTVPRMPRVLHFTFAITLVALSFTTACGDDSATTPDGSVDANGDGARGGDASDASDAGSTCATTPGALISEFGTDGVVRFGATPLAASSSSLVQMAVQSDGKIVVAGPLGADFDVARLMPDGSLDASFGTGGLAGATAPLRPTGVIVTDPHIIVLGRTQMLRLLPDGSLDTTVGPEGRVTIPETAGFTTQPDGMILLAGRLDRTRTFDATVTRITADGTPDPTFGTGGQAIVPIMASSGILEFSDVVVAGDRIVAGGSNNRGNAFFAAFDMNGTQDMAFGTDGALEYTGAARSSVMSMVYDEASGQVFFAAFFREFIMPINDTGVAVGRFAPADGSGLGATEHVYPFENEGGAEMAMTPAGRFVVGGPYARDLTVLRVLADQSADPAFGTDGFARVELPTEERFRGAVAVSNDGSTVFTAGFAITDFDGPTAMGEVAIGQLALCP